VVPACAGVNFLITAFLSLCLGLAPACRSLRARAGVVVASGAAAYAVTVLANATRLSIAMRLHENGAALGWLTPARLHCAVGVAVYFLFLAALFAVATRALGGGRALAS
jgi:exosortase K